MPKDKGERTISVGLTDAEYMMLASAQVYYATVLEDEENENDATLLKAAWMKVFRAWNHEEADDL